MSSANNSSSLGPERLHFDPKDPFVEAAVALFPPLLQFAVLFLTSSSQTRTFLFVVVFLLSIVFFAFAARRKSNYFISNFLFVFGMLAAIGYYMWLDRGNIIVIIISLPKYYVHVTAYPYDERYNTLDIDHPLSNIPITVRDQYGPPSTTVTSRDGVELKLLSYGAIRVGACGVYQSHVISQYNRSAATALPIKIGIDRARLASCRE